jgi:hypothetical protein
MQILRSDVTKKLFSKISRMDDIAGFANRVLYPKYREKQIERWEIENKSEGDPWPALEKSYVKVKLRRFAKYTYAGRRMGVATGRLLKSAVGPHADHKKVRLGGGFLVLTSVPYAPHFDRSRRITGFSQRTQDEFMDMVRRYLLG